MAFVRQRALPLSVCMLTTCALNFTHGAVVANRQCPAVLSTAAQGVQRSRPAPKLQQRARSSVSVTAAMAPIIVPPNAPHTGSVIMLHGLGDTGAG